MHYIILHCTTLQCTADDDSDDVDDNDDDKRHINKERYDDVDYSHHNGYDCLYRLSEIYLTLIRKPSSELAYYKL